MYYANPSRYFSAMNSVRDLLVHKVDSSSKYK